MIVFVTGGSGCGKSEYAEKIAVACGGDLIYVATMPVYGKEDEAKVARHHRLRAGKGFTTIERPNLLTDIPSGGETVLIECMSTHTANVLFGSQRMDTLEGISSEEAFALVQEEFAPIFARTGHTIVVSAEVNKDGAAYDEMTEQYKHFLARVNNWLAARADAAVEVVYGIPVYLKGESCLEKL